MSRGLSKPARADMARCLRWKQYGQDPRQARVSENPRGSLRLTGGGVNKKGAIQQVLEWHGKLSPHNPAMPSGSAGHRQPRFSMAQALCAHRRCNVRGFCQGSGFGQKSCGRNAISGSPSGGFSVRFSFLPPRLSPTVHPCAPHASGPASGDHLPIGAWIRACPDAWPRVVFSWQRTWRAECRLSPPARGSLLPRFRCEPPGTTPRSAQNTRSFPSYAAPRTASLGHLARVATILCASWSASFPTIHGSHPREIPARAGYL